MKNAIFGFPDEHGKEPSVLLFGPENGVELNLREFADHKAGIFPDGIARTELWWDDPGMETQVAINHQPKAISQPKKMKTKIIGALIALAFLIGISAQAQGLTEPTFVGPESYKMLTIVYDEAAGTNVASTATVIDVRKTSNISFMGGFSRAAAGTNTTIYFGLSVDGSNFPTNYVTAAETAWGTTNTIYGGCVAWQIPDTIGIGASRTVVCGTNFPTYGYGYIKMLGVGGVWDADQDFTNNWMKYSYKINAP